MISYFGSLMDMPKWLLKISPYYWNKRVPVESINTDAALWMLVIAVILIVVGFIGYNKRDLES